MPKQEFSFSAADLILLRKFYKRSPNIFGRSVIGTLNTLAFDTRKNLIERIDDQMVIRDKKFINRQMKVLQARGTDIQSAQSEVGSVRTNRFTGWTEQEFGLQKGSNRTLTLMARRGSAQNKASPSARAKPSNNFAKISDFKIKAKSRRHRLTVFLQMMGQQKRRFIMPRRRGKMIRGIYKATSKKLVSLQRFEHKKVVKNPWMEPTIEAKITPQIMRNIWANNISRALPRRL
ncbi:MAG: hypothetical protein KAS93_08175 [Gammaproteobacteria bacterium]|nr:hypothetical protein [Gammaproteobacteria bacterium]